MPTRKRMIPTPPSPGAGRRLGVPRIESADTDSGGDYGGGAEGGPLTPLARHRRVPTLLRASGAAFAGLGRGARPSGSALLGSACAEAETDAGSEPGSKPETKGHRWECWHGC